GVRLVRREGADGSGHYKKVRDGVQRSFLKIQQSRPLDTGNPNQAVGEWTIEAVEVVQLAIPPGSAKSSEDGAAPQQDAVLGAGFVDGYEKRVDLLPIEVVDIQGPDDEDDRHIQSME